jgi:hypothetical protein
MQWSSDSHRVSRNGSSSTREPTVTNYTCLCILEHLLSFFLQFCKLGRFNPRESNETCLVTSSFMAKCPAPFVKESLARSRAKVTTTFLAELSNLLPSINYCDTQKSYGTSWHFRNTILNHILLHGS